MRPCGLQPARLLCPWDSPGKNTGVGCHFPLQGIFPTQGSNPGLLHCRLILYSLSLCASGPRSRPPPPGSLQDCSNHLFIPPPLFSLLQDFTVFQVPPLDIPSSPEGRCRSLTLLDRVPLYSQPQRACPVLCLQAFGGIQEHVITIFLFSRLFLTSSQSAWAASFLTPQW